MQVPSNTVDVRGKRADAALASIDEFLGSECRGSTAFIVHGIGSGKLKRAVQASASFSLPA